MKKKYKLTDKTRDNTRKKLSVFLHDNGRNEGSVIDMLLKLFTEAFFGLAA